LDGGLPETAIVGPSRASDVPGKQPAASTAKDATAAQRSAVSFIAGTLQTEMRCGSFRMP
jgi:hypothetical protein